MTAEKTQTEIEATLVKTLKVMAIRKGRGMLADGWSGESVARNLLGKAASLHEGKAERRLVRMGYDPYLAVAIVRDCTEVAINEACIELGI